MDIEGDDDVYEEYTWAGQTRIRATSMLPGGLAGETGCILRIAQTAECRYSQTLGYVIVVAQALESKHRGSGCSFCKNVEVFF